MITFLQAINLIIAIGNIFLGTLVLKRNPKSKINITFSLFAFVSGLWLVVNFLSLHYPTAFLFRATYSVGIFLVPAATAWVFVLCFSKLKPFTFYYLIIVYILGFFFSGLALTPYVIKSGTSLGGVENGVFFPIFSFYLLAGLFLWLVVLIYSYRKESGLKKQQILYTFLGIFLFGSIAMTLDTILPLFGVNKFAMLDSPCSIFFVGFATYAIIKHRLMDIRLVILRSITYSFLLGLVALAYVSTIFYLKDIFQSSLNTPPSLTLILAGFLTAFLFEPTKKLFENATNQIFFKKRYNPEKLLDLLADLFNSTLELDKLLDFTLTNLLEEMKLRRGAFILRQFDKTHYKQAQDRSFKEKKKFYQRGDSFNLSKISPQKLFNLIQKDILVTDEIENQPETSQSKAEKTKELLRKNEISLILPLKIEDKLTGLLILGDKKSGDIYTKEDIDFLELLAPQLSLAINKAFSFEKVLEDEKKIKTLLSKQKEWQRQKNELISIAIHEVNTPLAALEGYLSMLISQKPIKLSKQNQNYLNKAYTSYQKSSKLIKDIMKAQGLR